MIHHELLMRDGEYVWEEFFAILPRIVTHSRVGKDNKPEVFQTFVWLERIERRYDKQREPFAVYEYRLLEKQKPI